MIQTICSCKKPVIDKRLKYSYLTTLENPKPKRMLNPVQHCKKCSGVIQKRLSYVDELIKYLNEKVKVKWYLAEGALYVGCEVLHYEFIKGVNAFMAIDVIMPVKNGMALIQNSMAVNTKNFLKDAIVAEGGKPDEEFTKGLIH